jgi:hypothetical protein
MKGDLQKKEKPKVIEWSKSAAKQVSKQYFREETISSNYQDAKLVWRDHCKDNCAFKRMQCDTAFVWRLKTEQDDYWKKVERCQKNLLVCREHHDSYTQCKIELESKFRGIEETKSETLGDKGAHLKRSFDDTDSLDSDDMHELVAAVNSSIY